MQKVYQKKYTKPTHKINRGYRKQGWAKIETLNTFFGYAYLLFIVTS